MTTRKLTASIVRSVQREVLDRKIGAVFNVKTATAITRYSRFPVNNEVEHVLACVSKSFRV